ncbi:MAG: radical SAM protein [Pseudomonadota bacterium]
MTDILLVQPPIRDFYLTKKRTIPYGLGCIASALLNHGFSVEIFDALATFRSREIEPTEDMAFLRKYYGEPDISPFALFHKYRHYGYSFEHIGKVARSSGAFLVGISSLFTPYGDEALKTAETVRAFHPDCKIVLGGHHPTVLPSRVMANRAVDFILRGEGEGSMPLLARAVKDGGDFHSIPGIVFRNHHGEILANDPASTAEPKDYLPPATHLIRHSFYRRAGRGSMVVVASRGCPLRCTYCSVGASSYLKYRRRPVEAVIAEIEKGVTHHDARFIDFEDENLSMDRKWFLGLLQEIRNRFEPFGLELRAMNGLFPDSLDEETVRAMKQAGFRTLNLSLGSTSKEQLDRFQRPDVRKAFDHGLVLAEKYGLEVVGYIIAGGPFQNPQHSLEDLLFLARRRVLAGISIFYPSPGSADYELCRSLNLLPSSFSLMRSSALPLSHTTSRDDSATLLRLGRILNFMKYLIDRDAGIPAPAKPEKWIDTQDKRIETGKKLLQWFLFDGKIRGARPDGPVFEHHVSPQLAEAFLENLSRMRIQGVTRTGAEIITSFT